MCQAAHNRDDSALSLDIHNQLWDCGGYETDVSQWQIEEEKLHGGLEIWVRADSHNDEKIPKHCDQVHDQKYSKEDGLQFWILWESHEVEFWDTC